MADDGKGRLAFSFTKKIEQKKLQDSKLRDESTNETNNETDYVLSVSGKKIESSLPVVEETELIIPLIVKNNWRVPNVTAGSNVKAVDGASDLETRAVQELLAETKKFEEADQKAANMVIPILMQNKIPEGFETDDAMDVSLRANESTLDDYERIPVEAYGMAMLKGMGWKPGEGIGLKNKGVVASPEPVLRPKGLGLGADVRTKLKPSGKEKEDPRPMIVGAYVRVIVGPHQDLYGQIVGLDMDNARVMVKMALSSKTITISELSVIVVSAKEFKKEGKLINKSKYEEYQAKADVVSDNANEVKAASRSNREKHHDIERKENDRKRSHSSQHPGLKKSGKSGSLPTWAHPLLRVRFIDKSYKSGRYYNTKVVIEDVVSKDKCVCRTDSGHILEDIREDWLETLIPKAHPGIVMVVKGSFKGQLGEVLDKNKKKCLATVQLLQEKDVLQLDYDSICEYGGKIADF